MNGRKPSTKSIASLSPTWGVRSKAFDPVLAIQQMFKRLDTAVLSGSWLAIVIACTGFILDYFLNLALSQWLSPADLGDYSVAVSIAVFGGMFALFGTDQAVMQYLPQYLEDRDWQRVRGLLTFSCLTVLVPSLLVSALAMGYAAFSDKTIMDHHPALLSLIVLPVVTLALLTSKTLRGFRHIVLASAPIGVCLPLLIMGGGYYLARSDDISDWILMAIFGASFLMVLCIQVLAIARHLWGRFEKVKPQFERQEWSTAALSLMMASVLFVAMEQVGLYICELFSSEEDVAIYAVLVKHARFLLIIYMAVNLSVLPYISNILRSGDQRALQRLYGTSMHVVMWGGLIPLLVFAIKGEAILGAFGPEYTVGYSSLLILMAAYYLNFIGGFSVPFLQFSGHRQIVVKSISVALAVEVLLFSILVPAYGFAGAVWSMAITLSSLSLWLTYQCHKRLGLRPLGLS